MKIFITGATGLVGSNLLAQCILNNIQVVALKRSSSLEDVVKFVFEFYKLNYEKECGLSFIWKEAGLSDTDFLSKCMMGCDVVVHCAADVGLGGVDEKKMHAVNVEFTRSVLVAAKRAGVKRFCYLSSIAALGNGNPVECIDENTLWKDDDVHSAYGRSKREAMNIVLEAEDDEMKCVAVCPGPILGVNCRNSGSSQIIYLAKRGVPFATKGGSGYVDVRDVCKAILLLLHENFKEKKYVLVSENVSNLELIGSLNKGFGKMKPMVLPKWLVYGAAYLAEGIYAIVGKKPQLDRNMARTITNRSYYSSERIKNEFNFEFLPLKKSISDICEFMKDK